MDASMHDITCWVEKGYSFVVMHRMFDKMGVEGSESMVRRYVHRNFPLCDNVYYCFYTHQHLV